MTVRNFQTTSTEAARIVYPDGTQRLNNVDSTSRRLSNVESTLFQRCVPASHPLSLTRAFAIRKEDSDQTKQIHKLSWESAIRIWYNDHFLVVRPIFFLSGHGFKLSPVVGKILGQLAAGKTPSCNMKPFKIDRFFKQKLWNFPNIMLNLTQLAFFINLQRAVIGPSATQTGR